MAPNGAMAGRAVDVRRDSDDFNSDKISIYHFEYVFPGVKL